MFRLRALGGLTLERDGVPHAGPATQRRRLAVLAVLAASDAGVSRDRLIDQLWPEAEPGRGRHSLDEALSRLRRELGSDALFLGVATLRLNPAVLASDLAEQTAALVAGDAERAVALYRGPFLDGFFVPDAGPFEQWVDAERARRAQAHAHALEALAVGCASRGDGAGAVRWWQARVTLDPLDTPATLGLLGALTAAGNLTEALRAARVHEALVREEFGGAPGPGWAAAVDAILAESARPPAARSAAVEAPADRVTAPALSPESPAVQAPSTAPLVPSERPAAASTPAIGERWRTRPVVAATAAALLVGGLAGWAGLAGWTRRPATPRTAALAAGPVAAMRSSVAVLPFANTGGDPTDEAFTDGLTDELIGALSRVPGVRVTGRTSAFALKGRGLSVRTIADTLGVWAVLEGSARRAGGRLRITVQLVSAADNAVLWSGAYDREITDVFAVQEEIARAIVGALRPTLGGRPGPVGPLRPRDLATYELYLKGRYFSSGRAPGDFRRAADYFEQAVARDPTYAPAQAGLADARVLLVSLANARPDEQVPRARAAAAEAIRLDSTLAEAHAALGNIRAAFDWDSPGADRAFARAVALDPGYAAARLYWGVHLLNQGRFDAAVAQLTRARALDPLSAPVRMQLGRAYVSAHRPREAVASLRAALELNPALANAHVQLGDAFLQQGKGAEAVAAFRRAAALSAGRDSAVLAYGLAVTGQRAEAARLLAALVAAPERPYLARVPVAKAYVALGDADAAFRWLERGAGERAGAMRMIKVMPAFDPLHDDPRWARLLRRMGLEPESR